MRLIAGVDIGNSTTEVCIGERTPDGRTTFLASASRPTTGTKGTVANIHGIKAALKVAMGKIGRDVSDIEFVRLNEAAPVIGDTAMETLTETVITDSSMIGHNPSTPAGAGQAVGELLSIRDMGSAVAGTPYILVVPKQYGYEQVAAMVNQAARNLCIEGIILQADEAVLVYNRLEKKIPIIDEVVHVDKIPVGQQEAIRDKVPNGRLAAISDKDPNGQLAANTDKDPNGRLAAMSDKVLNGQLAANTDRVPKGHLAAIEVALAGQSIRMLSNPYGIATLLHLTPDETKAVTPIAKSLIGKRSAVVIKTPNGNIRENVLPAGEIYLEATKNTKINLDEGAEKIMQAVSDAGDIRDITGQANTNVGNMLTRIKNGMNDISEELHGEIRITDILAVDTLAPVLISGALAGETCLEKAVGIAAMVKTQQLPMRKIAEKLSADLNTEVVVAGVEAVMASLGALTTPGTKLPLAILDMGGGSTDAALIDERGRVTMTHQAGAGELVSMLIQTELGLADRHTAEEIKKYPLAKVESLFHMRMENGQMTFVDESIDPRFYGRVVLLAKSGLIRLEEDIPMEKIVQVRREAKRKVFVTNAFRALKKVAPDHELKNISNVVLVGGSAEDFEIPEMLMEEFANYRIVCGRGNIRGTEGPRNAVATGLVLSYRGEQ